MSCQAPGHCKKQFRCIFNKTLRNNLHWDSFRKTNNFFDGDVFENVVCNIAAVCLDLNMLKCILWWPVPDRLVSTTGDTYNKVKLISVYWCKTMPCKLHAFPVPQVSYITHWGRIKNGRHFSDDVFKWIFLIENVWISIDMSLKFVPNGPINNIPLFV